MAKEFASQEAEKRAEELGVDPEEVEGTGSDGRVKVSDVEAFAEVNETEVAESESFEPPPEPVSVVLNPAVNLGAYDFGDGFGMQAGESKTLAHEDYERYSKHKVNAGGQSRAVIVKA